MSTRFVNRTVLLGTMLAAIALTTGAAPAADRIKGQVARAVRRLRDQP